MEGMTFVFHAASALTALGLGWALMKARSQEQFLIRLLRAVNGSARPVDVAAPREWLRRFAAALGISFEDTASYDLPPRRMQGWVLMEVFLRHGITLIRCSSTPSPASAATLFVQLTLTSTSGTSDTLVRDLIAALGDGIEIQFVESGHAPKAPR